MDFTINNKVFHLLDTLERIPSKDSFTHEDNKTKTGKGAWEWHIGSKKDKTKYAFFEGHNFSVKCFLRKSDLLWLMNELKEEYQKPSLLYRERTRFSQIWNERVQEINQLPDISFFQFREHDRRNPSDLRLYAKRPGNDAEGDDIYGIIRKLALPGVTFVSILKLKAEDREILYYFKIFPEYIAEKIQDQEDAKIIQTITESPDIDETEKVQLIKSRVGQGIFRKRLLDECCFCPITGVEDTRFLIASHIKPWKSSSNQERLFVKNGLLFTPTYDKLFDNGFISFTNERQIIISPWISNENRIRLNLFDGKEYPLLPISGREEFLEYHRVSILKK